MKSTPIIFSTEMVRAILSGRKTQTRRIVSPTKKNSPYGVFDWYFLDTGDYERLIRNNKFGVAGDRLWVRETWANDAEGKYIYAANWLYDENYGSETVIKWKPSIHMPREACRLFLEITDIRIELLKNISEEDAKAEGACLVYEAESGAFYYPESDTVKAVGNYGDHKTGFKSLWQSIYGPGSWDANPYVWVISFKVFNGSR